MVMSGLKLLHDREPGLDEQTYSYRPIAIICRISPQPIAECICIYIVPIIVVSSDKHVHSHHDKQTNCYYNELSLHDRHYMQ